MKEESHQNIKKEKIFWTLQRFFVANGFVVLLFFFGFQISSVDILSGSFVGFAISSVFVWYFVLSIVWWVVISSFIIEKFKARRTERFPFSNITKFGVWFAVLIPTWFLFLAGLNFYVTVNFGVS